jgi:hypothetical protein
LIPQEVSQLAVINVYPKIVKYLAPAIAHNRCSPWTLDTVYNECMSGRMILFVDDMLNPTNCLIAQFVTWDNERVFYICFMGGEGNTDWTEAFAHMKAFATRFGVSRVSAWLRDGWLKHLKVKRLVTLCDIEG